MAVIRIKRSTGSTAPVSLGVGEPAATVETATQGAWNNKAGRLFVGNASGVPVEVGGEYYTELLNHQQSILTNDSAVIVGAAGSIDHWNVVGMATFQQIKVTAAAEFLGDVTLSNPVTFDYLSGTSLTVNSNFYSAGVTTLQRAYIPEDLNVVGLSTFVGFSTFGANVAVADSVGVGTGFYATNAGDVKVETLVITGLSTNRIPYLSPNGDGEPGKPQFVTGNGLIYNPAGFGTGPTPEFVTDAVAVSIAGTVYAPTGVVTTINGTTLTYTNGSINDLTLGVGTEAYAFPNQDATTAGWILRSDSNGTLNWAPNDARLNYIGRTGAGATSAGTVGLNTETFEIWGTANEIDTVAVGRTITIGLPDEVIIGTALTVSGPVSIAGSLAVEGSVTYLDSTITQIKDKKIDLAYSDSPNDTNADGGGISIKGNSDYEITWASGVGAFQVNQSWLPYSNNTYDLGSDSVQWRNIYVDGYVDTDEILVSGIGTLTSADINGGNIDSTVIGAAVSTTAYFERIGWGATAHATQLTLLSGTVTSLQVTGITTLGRLFSSTSPDENGVGYAGSTGEVGFTSSPSAGISTSHYLLTSVGIATDDRPVWTDTIDCGTY